MQLNYQYLQIEIRPSSTMIGHPEKSFDDAPLSFGKWLNEWLGNILIEDYDELQFYFTEYGYGLLIPVGKLTLDALEQFLNTGKNFSDMKNTLVHNARINQSEYRIHRCYMT